MSDILLVEDNVMISKMIMFRLKARGHNVETGFNGQEGYDLAKSKSYDAILLDMHMPVLDGHSAVKMLRESGYKGLVIAVTASAMVEECQKALDSGCNYFIAKPIDDDFEDCVETYIKKFQAAS